MINSPEDDMGAATEAYFSFGGWAKLMPNPPGLHERRRYTVDVECTGAGIKSTEKGERHTRALSIIRVVEVAGVVVPPVDEDPNQGELFEPEPEPEPGEQGGDGNVVPMHKE